MGTDDGSVAEVEARWSDNRAETTRAWAGHLRLAGLLLAAWVWLRYSVDPSLGYFAAGLTACPAFSPDPIFLHSHLAVPGGPLRYVAAWLAQYLATPGSGALLLLLPVAAAAVVIDRLGTVLAGRRLAGWRYLPGMVFLYCDAQYYHLLDWQLGWVLAWFVAAGTMALQRRPAERLAILLAAMAALYYVAGGAMLVAVPLVAIHESRRPDGRWAATLGVLWTAALPWLSTRYGFDRALGAAYREWIVPPIPNDSTATFARSLSFGLPCFSLLLAGWSVEARSRPQPSHRAPSRAWAGWACLVLLVPMMRCGQLQRDRLELCALGVQEDWPGVLRVADRLPAGTYGTLEGYVIVRALAELGQLNEAMFNYSVLPFSYLRNVDPRVGDSNWLGRRRARLGVQLGDLDLQLGFVNSAEHHLHEGLEISGTYPSLLLPMARIQVLKGRPEAARVFLRLAAAQSSGRAPAKAMLAALELDPTLTSDPLQARFAERALQADHCDEKSITRQFELLVAEHPDNRLATDYLLGWHLLSQNVDDVVAAIPALPVAGCASLPTHVEEAVLCWEAIHRQPADLGPWRIRPATRARFEAFVEALGCGSDEVPALFSHPPGLPDWAVKLYDSPWSNTYYYYHLFGRSERPR